MSNVTKENSAHSTQVRVDYALEGKKPNPGSDAAVAMGCTCPRMDNGYGRLGDDIGAYWITENCPVHDAL